MDFALGGGGSLADDDGSGANEQSEEVWCSLRQYLQRGSGLALPVNVHYTAKSQFATTAKFSWLWLADDSRGRMLPSGHLKMSG